MSKTLSKLASKTVHALALCAAPLFLGTCAEALEKLCGGAGGIEAAQSKVNAVVMASNAVDTAARGMSDAARAACTAMAADLGLAAPADTEATDVLCKRVTDAMDATLRANLEAGASLTITYNPPVCVIDVELEHNCVKTCKDVEVTETQLQCKPGKLSGMCGATCTGSCSATCDGMCTGSCSGSCNASCTGTCNGDCTGTCSAMDGSGKCAGTCTGTCNGTCTGTCSAGCNGTCYAQCMGSCSASCTGGCSVSFQAPKCVEVERTYTKTECTQSCETKSRAEASCSEPQLLVEWKLRSGGDLAALDKVGRALKNNYGKILAIAAKAGDVIAAIDALVTQAAGLPKAIACAGAESVQKVEGALTALGNVKVNLQVSVTVSASFAGTVATKGGA